MLRLQTLGGWEATRDGVSRQLPPQRVALLALLVASRDHGVARDRAAALLWPESTEEHARHSLGQSLYALRRDAASSDVVLGTATLRLNPTIVSCDAWELDAACEAGDLSRVASLYAGPFLDGVHVRGSAELDQLLDAERSRLARVWAEATESLAGAALAAGNPLEATARWRRLAGAEPLSSRIALGLVQALVAAGDRTAALQAARVHETLVRSELDTEPDPRFVAYADALRRDTIVSTRVAPDATPRLGTTDHAPRQPTEDTAAVPAPNANHVPLTRNARRTLVRTLAAAAASTALVVGGARFVRGNDTVDARRVHVAWFANRTGDPTLDAIGGMAADWLAQGVQRSGMLTVASAARAEDGGAGSLAPNAARSDPLADAARLGAGTVVSGAYYTVAGRLRFHVEIADVARGEILGSFETSGSSADDPTASVENVRQRALGGLASLVDPRLQSWVRVTSTPPTYAAYREFVTGQSIWGSNHRQALGHFLRAAALDSSFYAARVEAATLHRLLGECDHTEAIATELLARPERLAAYEYHMLGQQVAQCEGDWERSYREARAVAELRPHSAFLEYSLALQAMQLGRFSEANALLERHPVERGVAEVGPNYAVVCAQVLSALDYRGRGIDVARWLRARYLAYAPAWSIEALLLARAGRIAEAEALTDSMVAQPLAPSSAVVDGMRRVAASIAAAGDSAGAERIVAHALELAERDPRSEVGKPALDRAKLLYESGRLDDAASLLERLAASDSSDVDIRGYLGFVAARRRDATTVAGVDAWLAASHTPFSYTRTLYRARIAAMTGQRARALGLLAAGLDEANRFMVPAIREYPELAPLRGEQRFEQLLALR